jgi:multidrug efflux pump
VIAHFFIDRPIFASVLSIVITLTGALALYYLPIAQYPPITPPGVQVAIQFPGASAQVVADTVAAPIEQQVNGVPGMLYMSSQSGNDGSYTLTVTFDIGTNLNTALVMVQNRVTLAMPQLPTQVQQQGITIRKKTPDILQVINFYSPDGRYDNIYLSNFATINVRDVLLRVEGVSDVTVFGQRDYSIRAWLDPQKLASRNMTALDVADAIRSQNVEAPAGRIGQPPAPRRQAFDLAIHTLGRLTYPEQFADIIVKVGQDLPLGYLPLSPSSPPVLPAPPPAPPPASLMPPYQQNTSPQQMIPLVGLPNTVPQGTVAGLTGLSSQSGTTSATTQQGQLTPPTTTAQPGQATQPGQTSSQPSPTTSQPSSTSPTGAMGQTGTTNPLGPSLQPGQGAQPGILAPPGLTLQPAPGAGAPATGSVAPVGQPTQSGPPGPSTSIVRLRDVARVELGAQNYNQNMIFDGLPSVGLAVFQLPGSNALDVAERVQQAMRELKTRFPDGVEYSIAYDTTPFIRESVMDVVHTLLEAVGLVAVVVLVFLQNWRAAVIPLVAVPVAIIGTFAVMAALGFSLNNISLFGLVLAIGIVVDDAIVVVENVERWLEQGLPPRDAARRAMDEVTGPVIAVGLVLCAVFVPCAFISGITGQFFRQFAVTIAVSTAFSAFNSLTLSPALAAILLRPHGGRRDPLTWLLDVSLGWLFRGFNAVFGAGTRAYGRLVGLLVRLSVLVLLLYGGLLFLTYWVFESAPTGFIPQQDQGRLIVNVQLPDSASLERTQEVVAQVDAIARQDPGIAHIVAVSGMSFLLGGSSSNFGSLFVILQPFEKRRSPELGAEAIMARLRRAWAEHVQEAEVTVFGAPPIPGLGVAGGFKLMVEDRGGLGLDALQTESDRLTARLGRQPGLVGVLSLFRSNTPQLYLDIDRRKVASLGVSLGDVDQTLGIYLGSLYVNSFNEFGRYWQVTVQAEGRFRNRLSAVNLLEVRNQWGEMVPLGTVGTLREIGGPVTVTRYNLYSAAPITGNLAPGVNTGPAISAIEDLAGRTLPRSMGIEWTEIMFMQIRAGNTALAVFGLSVVFVFLALAALYESWSLPLAVILVVPLCLLCSVAGVLFTHNAVNIFVQIGLVVLVGLACKNSILIVEFAQQLHRQGRPRFEATVEASRLRLRPILMTSFAFILGVLPLVLATGAGAEMRRSLGTAVFSGMLGVTLFGVFLTPVFFYVIEGLSQLRLFAALTTRWLGSAVWGGLLGWGFGYLLQWVAIAPPPWGEVASGGAGVLAGLLVPTLQGLRRGAPAGPRTTERGPQA